MSVIDFDTDRLDLSFSGSYPVKESSLWDFEVLSRDMIRILSHAEIFSFAALKCLQSGNMDSMSMVMRHEAAIESAPKALLLQRQRESFVLLLVPLSYC